MSRALSFQMEPDAVEPTPEVQAVEPSQTAKPAAAEPAAEPVEATALPEDVAPAEPVAKETEEVFTIEEVPETQTEAPGIDPSASQSSASPGKRCARRSPPKAAPRDVPQPRLGSRSMLGKQPKSKHRSAAVCRFGKDSRVAKPSGVVSPGPAFLPKQTLNRVSVPSYSFAGSCAALPPGGYSDPSIKPAHMVQHGRESGTALIPVRFRGGDLSSPGPARYRLESGFGGFGATQNLSKRRGVAYTMRCKTAQCAGDVTPSPTAYKVSPGLGRQRQAKFRSNLGFGFGRERRDQEPRYQGPGPGSHYI